MRTQSHFTTTVDSTVALYSDAAQHNGRKQQRDRSFKRITNKQWRYVQWALAGLVNRRSFARVENLCLFIGYPRSGHSLIGSLLDAHPNAIIADELDALKYVHADFSKNQIFYLLLRSCRQPAAGARQRTGYSYNIPGQWQGRFKEVRVIGDKMGHATAVRLGAFPFLLDRLSNGFDAKLKFIHIMRNPYDIISTMTRRSNLSLENSCDQFFIAAEGVEQVKQRMPDAAIRDLRHEDFVADPKTALKRLCAFLNLEEDPDSIDDA